MYEVLTRRSADDNWERENTTRVWSDQRAAESYAKYLVNESGFHEVAVVPLPAVANTFRKCGVCELVLAA
jgi:prophage antirepressor-like protein